MRCVVGLTGKFIGSSAGKDGSREAVGGRVSVTPCFRNGTGCSGCHWYVHGAR